MQNGFLDGYTTIHTLDLKESNCSVYLPIDLLMCIVYMYLLEVPKHSYSDIIVTRSYISFA